MGWGSRPILLHSHKFNPGIIIRMTIPGRLENILIVCRKLNNSALTNFIFQFFYPGFSKIIPVQVNSWDFAVSSPKILEIIKNVKKKTPVAIDL